MEQAQTFLYLSSITLVYYSLILTLHPWLTQNRNHRHGPGTQIPWLGNLTVCYCTCHTLLAHIFCNDASWRKKKTNKSLLLCCLRNTHWTKPTQLLVCNLLGSNLLGSLLLGQRLRTFEFCTIFLAINGFTSILCPTILSSFCKLLLGAGEKRAEQATKNNSLRKSETDKCLGACPVPPKRKRSAKLLHSRL